MITLLLILIYLAFISLGLPDSLLGVAWPAIRGDWNLPLDMAGYISLLVTASAVTSSLFSGVVIKKLGTGTVVFMSCAMTGGALMGISISPAYFWLLLLAIPLGLGAGTVDSALNNYVALHYKAHHMNWLHSFWGVGATLGPLIMATTMKNTGSWRIGYQNIGFIQLSLAFILLISLPLWGKVHQSKKVTINPAELDTIEKKSKNTSVFKIKGVKYALAVFMFYCTAEISVGLWGSSYLIQARGVSIEKAATWIALYYGGITAGRILSGFISFKLTNKQMIIGGNIIAFIATTLLLLPIPKSLLIIPLMLIGLGLAPIFPSMIHETPKNFGKENSQTIIGFQMASAYLGSALMPPLIGIALKNISMNIFPIFLSLSLLVVFLCATTLLRHQHPSK